MHLDVTTRIIGSDAVLVADGEIDLTSCRHLQEKLEQVRSTPAEAVVIDLTGVQFIDSTGLSVLVEGARDARNDGRAFGVVAGGHLWELLRITGLDTVMEVHHSLDDALGAQKHDDPALRNDAAPLT